MNFQDVAKKVLARAKKMGARQAEVFLENGRTSSVHVRDGEVEDVTEATSKGMGLRVFVKNRLGFAFTSDFDAGSLHAFVDRAILLAGASAPNPLNGLPKPGDFGTNPDVPGLFDPAVAALDGTWKIKTALEVEKSAKAVDTRIKTFKSVGAGDGVYDVYLASSEGFRGGYQGTYAYLFATPVASDGQQLQTSSWFNYKRFLGDLDSPENIGREAARRALRMLGARKVSSQQVPVVFDPSMTASFLGTLASAVNGDAVHQGSSFLGASKGKSIAPTHFTVLDDGRLARGLSSAPFDGEGVPTRTSAIVENGVLKSFLYDTFTARKAKTHSTGNASRSYRSLPSIGTHNLYLQPGTRTPEEIIKEVKNGFYVTSMLGHGINIVTGDYSRGANGLWIENGELAYPVQEVTVAGALPRMLASIDAVGNDLEFRSSTGAPTIRFSNLMVSGA